MKKGKRPKHTKRRARPVKGIPQPRLQQYKTRQGQRERR